MSTPAIAAPPKSNRTHQGNLYRQVGVKPIQIGLNATPGGVINLSQVVDLSLPIRAVRLVYKARVVVGTAGFTTPNPEGFLNAISSIVIQGTNARQKGNVTLWSTDLATLYGISHLCSPFRQAYYSINAQAAAGEVQTTTPGTPWPTDNNPVGATGTYDVRIEIDVPFHPFSSQSFGDHPHWIPAYLIRNEEWKDSLQLNFTFATQANGAVAGFLGTGAAGTTVVFTAYGSATGTPTLDVYSLPIIMGLDLKDTVLPGILSRTSVPLNTILQSAGTNVAILNMQKQPTTRVFWKFGTATVPPAFATLSDTVMSQIGILLGANRNVRNVTDYFSHKALAYDNYQRNLIQGYGMFDFMDSGNPDSAYPGQDIGDGATFQLTGSLPGTANGNGVIIQEQTLHTPTGAMYTF
jgi:hypothetical protein